MRCFGRHSRFFPPASGRATRCRLAASESSSHQRAFTLIEVLIVMVILGILAAIAIPSYREHIRKAARADMQAFLTDVASRQQQFLVDKRTYAPTIAALNLMPSAHIKAKFVDPITVDVPDVVPPTFRITALAVGDQAYDKCPTLVIDSAGNREPLGCW